MILQNGFSNPENTATGQRTALHITEQLSAELIEIGQSDPLSAGYTFRAKLILMPGQGASFKTINSRLSTTAMTIVRWKERFLAAGIVGLGTYHPGQKPTVLTPPPLAKILAATSEKPADHSTHWGCRKLTASLSVGKDAVYRVWKEAGSKPHRLEYYMVSNGPDFETKDTDIIRLYLNPPQHTAVFCVNEKTAIQALDRLDPVLSLSPDRVERHGVE